MHRKNSKSAGQKRNYCPPVLTRYGGLKDLTQGGSGSESEGKKSNAQNKQRPALSDRNAKDNIVSIGDHPLGFGLYLFDYKPGFRDQWGHGRQFGVMAQEVETVMPEAVCTHPDGYKMVHYGMLGISRADH